MPFVDPGALGSGVPLPSSWMNITRDNALLAARPPGVVIERNNATVPGSGTWTTFPFNAADLRDTDGFHSPGVNPGLIQIPAGLSGWYAISGMVLWAASNPATGNRWTSLLINGSNRREQFRHYSGWTVSAGPRSPFSDEVFLAASDTIELQNLQNSGADLVANARLAVRLVAAA